MNYKIKSLLECTKHVDIPWEAKAACIPALCKGRNNPGCPNCSSEQGGMIHIPDGHSSSVHVVAGTEHQVGMAVVISPCSLLFQMSRGAAGGGCMQPNPLETAAHQMDDFCHAVSFPASTP